MMKHLQKLGKAMMLPVAALPICGILMGLGYAFAPAVMGAAGASEGFMYALGLFLVKAGAALIDNMAILFAIGVGFGLTKDSNGTGGLAGMVSYLMMTTLLNPGTVTTIAPALVEDPIAALAFGKIGGNAFIGILAGIIGGVCYNKFKDTKLPDFLAFFSGRRFVAIVTGVVSIVVSAVLLFVWPLIFQGLVKLGQGIESLGAVGAGIYAFLNRLLMPLGFLLIPSDLTFHSRAITLIRHGRSSQHT
jgi:PTS system N-acetylglucosamine-specific IIC component